MDNQSKAPPSFFRIWLCGTLRAERRVGDRYEVIQTTEWGGSTHPRQLLKALLCCPGRQGRREALIELLWPEVDFEQAVRNFNTATTKLRAVLRPARDQESLLVTEDDAGVYRLADQQLLWVDADAGVALLKEAEQIGRTQPEALPLLEEAATYFNRGMLLEGEEGLWAQGKRATIERSRYRCRLWLAEAFERWGRPGQAEMILGFLLEEDLFDEDVLCRLMALWHRQGMTHKALQLYESSCQVFTREEQELSEATKMLAARLHEERHSLPLVAVDSEQIIPNRVTLTTTSDAQVSFLLPPSLPQKELIVSGSAVSQSETLPPLHSVTGTPGPVSLRANDPPLPEVVSGDCATWFSERLAHILMFVTQGKGRTCMTDFEKLLDRELRMFDTIKMMFDPDTYFLSRRSALLVIAALPKGLLGLLRQPKTAFIEEEFLPACAASITACWYLLNGREFASVERALARYMPFLIGWAQQSYTYQRTAAYLAAQACLLLGFIELHRLQFQQRTVYCKEAVKHAREAGNDSLLVKALTQLGNAYYDQGMCARMLQTYQEAKLLCTGKVPRSLQSKVLMGLAHAYAQHGEAIEALNTINEAREVFPGEIEDVPAFLAADDGEYSLILFEGWIRLDLGKRYPDRDYNDQAAKVLAQIDNLSTTTLVPERYRHEIINRRAQAAIALGDLDAFRMYTLQSSQNLQVMHSEKRRQEQVINYKTALRKWPHESLVVELADVVL